MSLDLTDYLPPSFVMTAGNLALTSPAPSVQTGKLLAAYMEIQAEQGRRAQAGQPPLETIDVQGWPETTEELARLMFGDREYERAVAASYPEVFIDQAATCAVIYWANGASEGAVKLYLAAIVGTDTIRKERTAPKGPRPSKSGPRTASASRSAKAKTAPSTPTTASPQTSAQ